MNNEDIDRLFDSKATVDRVDNRDLRWMLVFVRQEFQTDFGGLKEAIASQEASNKTLAEQVQANTVAVGKAQQAHDSCPLSDQGGRNRFVDREVKDAIRDAVQEANGTKPIIGPLNRMELFQVLGWVIVVLVVSLVFLATNGGVAIPLP